LVTPPVSRFSVPNPDPVFLGENPMSALYCPGPGALLLPFNEDPHFKPKVYAIFLLTAVLSKVYYPGPGTRVNLDV